MESLGFRDLVGRIMTDPDFLAGLVRDPTTVLADYTLSADERNTVLQAIGREGEVPTAERLRAVKTVMMKRWAMKQGHDPVAQPGDIAFLRQVDMLRALDEEQLAALWPRLRERRLRKGEVLFREGDPGEEM